MLGGSSRRRHRRFDGWIQRRAGISSNELTSPSMSIAVYEVGYGVSPSRPTVHCRPSAPFDADRCRIAGCEAHTRMSLLVLSNKPTNVHPTIMTHHALAAPPRCLHLHSNSSARRREVSVTASSSQTPRPREAPAPLQAPLPRRINTILLRRRL